MLLRALFGTSLLGLCVAALACGTSTGGDTVSSTSSALTTPLYCPPENPSCLLQPHGPPLPPPPLTPTPAECESYLPACTTESTTWASIVPEDSDASHLDANEAWIAQLQAAGCEGPLGADPMLLYVNKYPLAVVTCPDSVETIPLPPALAADTYAELSLGCNACFPDFPPAGKIRLAWGAYLDGHPGGCRIGSCDGLPIE